MAQTLTTGIGTSIYPKLIVPDTKFNADGLYSCRITVSEDDFKAFQAQLDPIVEKAYKATCTAQGKEVKRANTPVKINDDGEFEIFAKQAAKINVTPTADNPDGVVEFKIALYDANVKPITHEPKIGSGTKLKMSVTPYTWFVPSQGFGYTLRLKAVQILELKEYQQTGFTATEGYSASGETFGDVLEEDEVQPSEAAPF